MNKVILERLLIGIVVSCLSISVSAKKPTPPDPGTDPTCTADCGYERGPDPTVALLEQPLGPYAVQTIDVPSSVNGFGGGTIHYPTGTTGTMGVIAVVPGFVSYESSIIWWGPRIASHGFVVITIDTNSGFDNPDSRAVQQVAALDYVISESQSRNSPIYGMVDPNRRGVMGWSMGGGGTLKSAADDPSIMAALPQAPYYTGSNNFDTITTPTLIIACQNDTIAPVSNHASPFYYDIPTTTDKAFLEIAGGDHYCANSGNPDEDILGKYGVAWMKRFIDLDTRYDQFLCGPDHVADPSISEYRDTCNY